MLKPVRTVAPATALLTTGEAKAHLRVDHSDEDTFIDFLVEAATSYLDGYSGILGRALITQTWKVELEEFEDDEVCLPLGNLVSVTSVKYYDLSNTQQTLSTSVYGAYTDDSGPYIEVKAGQVWPQVYDREDAIEIIWQAGYGTTTASVPAAIRAGALLLIGHWYRNREAVAEGTFAELPMAAQALLAPYRLNPL